MLGVIFWLVVEWTTAFQPDFQRWLSYMPVIWLFYISYPLIFAYLIYKREWNNKRIFITTLVAAFIVEIVFTHNALLYTFPIMLLAIPVTVSIYSLLTFGPYWIIEEKIQENKWKSVIMTIVWILVSIATYASNTGSGSWTLRFSGIQTEMMTCVPYFSVHFFSNVHQPKNTTCLTH